MSEQIDAAKFPRKERSLDAIRRGEWGPKLQELVRRGDAPENPPESRSSEPEDAEQQRIRDAIASARDDRERYEPVWRRRIEDVGAYELSDPKHPRHHEVFSDIADRKEPT